MTAQSALLISLITPFLSALLCLSLGPTLKKYTAWIFTLAAAGSAITLLIAVNSLGLGVPQSYNWPWVQPLKINFGFYLDGLSTLYGFIVSGVGFVIGLYAFHYMDDHAKDHHKFYTYLCLFMGAMLGAVFSSNVIMLFIFWELTSITSFFLIGFFHEKESSQVGARMAFLVTAGTGLCLLAGVTLLALQGGSFNWFNLLVNGAGSGPLKEAALVLLLLGAFGKSAQFPFHFWLPNAMEAPTPVSAYLHSATMVKLGLYLIARIAPLFQDLALWSDILVPIGTTTILIGCVLAFLSQDLKAILAYSTVAQLGFIVTMYGFHQQGAEWDSLHILNHVFYKGSLFMVAGIVDHTVHNRDIRKLGGLFRSLPVATIACAIACLAMAGGPFTTGFLSKELFVAGLLNYAIRIGGLAYLAPLSFFISAALMVAFSLRLVLKTFFGKPTELPIAHKPSLAFQFTALIPTSLALILGLVPWVLESNLKLLASPHSNTTQWPDLHLWPGFHLPLYFSLGAITLGCILYALANKRFWETAEIPKALRFHDGFNWLYKQTLKQAKDITDFLRDHKPFDYLLITITVSLFVLVSLLVYLKPNLQLTKYLAEQHDITLFGGLSFIIILEGTFGVVLFKKRVMKLISLSITGLLITFYFVLYQAPDLALTQLLVEVVSLILVLLMLTRLPLSEDNISFRVPTKSFRGALNLLVSVGFGGFMTLITFWVSTHSTYNPIGQYFIENTISAAHGRNAVNTILVDFRGYDTMGEISVLTIALLGGLGLVLRKTRSTEDLFKGSHGPSGSGVFSEKEES